MHQQQPQAGLGAREHNLGQRDCKQGRGGIRDWAGSSTNQHKITVDNELNKDSAPPVAAALSQKNHS